MLVLTRKVGESIAIGDQIRVYVRRIDANRVRLAIAAPDDVNIQRLPRKSHETDRPRRNDV